MTKLKAVFSFAVLMSGTVFADIGGRAETECKQSASGNTKCVLLYDLSDNPRRYYQLHTIERESLEWGVIGQSHKSRGRFEVEPEGLYRVQGCDDQVFSLNCISSSAAWAPSLRGLDEIPPEMEIMQMDGTLTTASFVDTDSRYVVLSSYNVYALVDLVVRVALEDPSRLPLMLPQEEDADSKHRSLSHQINHNIQSNYEGLRLAALEGSQDQ